ncbi:SpdA protein [Streptomyces sp. NPDC048489]|uniref:SpdA protein n=1 Tax=Streptomyces sp. NPDC048489 TaxID=3154504 RepID=UPI0034414AD3
MTTVVFVIAGLSFAFGFGNGWSLGVLLGVPTWIAPLVAPAVDLSVVALLASLQYLRATADPGRLLGPRLLLAFCGLVTLALNTAYPLSIGAYGRACFDAIAPLLLIGWSEVGPWLLASLHAQHPEEPTPPTRREPEPPKPSTALVRAAAEVDAKHRQAHGRPVTREQLRIQLGVTHRVAGALVRTLRGKP